METIVKDFGKIVITVEEHDLTRRFEFPAVVHSSEDDCTYITKQNVPKGIPLSNKDFWLCLGGNGGSGSDIPLSVVNGKLCITYNK